MTLTDLPASLQLNIMHSLSDGRDLVSLGQVCPELGTLTEDRLLWKKLCQYHFTDRQACRNLRECKHLRTWNVQMAFMASVIKLAWKMGGSNPAPCSKGMHLISGYRLKWVTEKLYRIDALMTKLSIKVSKNLTLSVTSII